MIGAANLKTEETPCC